MAAAQVVQTLPDMSGGRSSINLISTSNGRSGSPMATSCTANAVQLNPVDKPVASVNGVSCSIILAEPNVYLTGFHHSDNPSNGRNSSAMIRGKLVLNITKSAKIKAVTLSFCGKARTEWPDGEKHHRVYVCMGYRLLIFV